MHLSLMFLSISNRAIQSNEVVQIIILAILDNRDHIWLWSRLGNVYLKCSVTVMKLMHRSPAYLPHTHYVHFTCSLLLEEQLARLYWKQRGNGWYTHDVPIPAWFRILPTKEELDPIAEWNIVPRSQHLYQDLHLGQANVPWPSFSHLMEKIPKTECHWCSSNYRVIWLELQ